MPRAGAESPARQGGHRGSRQPGEGPAEEKQALGKGRKGQGRFPHPAAAFCSRLGRSASFSRGCEFYFFFKFFYDRAEGSVLISRGEKRREGFSRQGQVGSGMKRRGRARLGATLAPGMRKASHCAWPGAGQHLGVPVRAPPGDLGCASPVFGTKRNRADSDGLGAV